MCSSPEKGFIGDLLVNKTLLLKSVGQGKRSKIIEIEEGKDTFHRKVLSRLSPAKVYK